MVSGFRRAAGGEATSLIVEETFYLYIGYFRIVGAVFNRDYPG
jgi:hypothetical protein